MPIEKTANFIRIRVAPPKNFVRFRVKKLGKGIKAVIGFLKGGGSQIQSLLFPKSRFTLAQAKAWVKSHNYKVSESFLVYDITVTETFLEWEEEVITPEMEAELMAEPSIEQPKANSFSDLSKEKLRGLFNGD